MKITLWVFTGGSRHFADEITSSVHTSLTDAEAAEREWLSSNVEDGDDDDDSGPWFGYVDRVELDYPI